MNEHFLNTFRDELLRMVGLTGEIKLRFQVSPA